MTVTQRDRVYAALVNIDATEVTVGDVRGELQTDSIDGMPSNATIRRTLRAAENQGILEHSPGSSLYRKVISKGEITL